MAGSLHCAFLDTGLMYREATSRALRGHVPLGDAQALARLADRIGFSLSWDDHHTLLIDNAPPDSGLHSADVDAAVSVVAAHPEVRSIMVQRQRSLSAGRAIVMVGRDIGTVVLPQAAVKLWVTASLAERVRRRRAQRTEVNCHDESAVASLGTRDGIDSTRAVSPSLPAPDATVLSTDGLSENEVLMAALAVVRSAVTRCEIMHSPASERAEPW